MKELTISYTGFHLRLCLLLSFQLLQLCFRLNAQQPSFYNFLVKDGLPSSEVYNVMEDSKGFLWFSTDAGVSRYDGCTFKTYQLENGLADNTVFGSFEDPKGRIWFRSLSGMLSYFKDDSIYRIKANPRIQSAIKNGIMVSLFVDEKDTLWAGLSVGLGYFKIAPPYQESDFSYIKFPITNGYVLNIDKKNYIYGSTSATESKRPSGLSLTFFSKTQAPIPSKHKTYVIPNSVYLQSKNGYYVTGKNQSFHYTNKGPEQFDSPTIPISLFMDKKENLWLGLYQNGVYVFDHGKLDQKNPRHYLPGLSVTSVAQDAEGGYWITTLEKGVFYMASDEILYFDASSGLQDNKVMALLPKDSTSVWVGLSDGWLDEVSIQGIKPVEKTGIYNIYTLHKGPRQLLMIGSVNSFTYNSQEKKSFRHLLRKNSDEALKVFASNRKGETWAGNYFSLEKIDPSNSLITKTFTAKSRILSLYCDDDGVVWLGCMNGLWKFANGVFYYEGDRNPLLKNRFESLQIASDGTWWLPTRGNGIFLKKGENITQLTQKDGLLSNTCRSLFIDQEGIVWVGTNKGIDKITKTQAGKYRFEGYTEESGLLSNEINQVVRSGNTIWASTNQGLEFFNVHTPSAFKVRPPVYLSSLSVNFDKYRVTDKMTFKYNENNFQLTFVGLAFRKGPGLIYKYQLEGLDTSWNYTSNSSVQFTNLPPGDYTFKVLALNSQGLASAKPASLHFFIDKPFWLKKWFYIPVIGLVVALILILFQQRIRIIKKRAIKEAEINNRITEIELKALRAQMNPHFIFNCIASIQHFILKNDPDSANKYLSKFSRLIRRVLINSTNELITLENELQTLELYIELEGLRFSSKFNYSLVVDKSLDPSMIQIPPMLMQPFVENAVWHGLLPLTERKGELSIMAIREDSYLKCVIEDNGVGRAKAAERSQKENHRSLGVSLTQERMENLNTLHQHKMRMEIIDKHDPDGVPLGTKVELYIPLNTAPIN